MTKDEVLKLSLEALEWEEAQTAYPSRMMTNAITAIKQALANHTEDNLEMVAPVAHIVGEIDHAGKVWTPAQPAPVQEPVAYQQRTRPNWYDETCWTLWEDCSKSEAEDCWNRPQIHDWLYEARALYTTPPAAPEQQADQEIQPLTSLGGKLALELECLLLECNDTAATSKWWNSAHAALEDWRSYLWHVSHGDNHVSPLGKD